MFDDDGTRKERFIAVAPAGVEWVAYDPSHVAPMKAR